MNHTANRICQELDLSPHPEGGWYRETWRSDDVHGKRAAGTAIHFLLATGERSHWHKVDAAEIWLWHSGDPLTLRVADEAQGPQRTIKLGPDISDDERFQFVVPPHHWQSAEPLSTAAGYSLVSCIVVPGFDFAGFTLAPDGWTPEVR